MRCALILMLVSCLALLGCESKADRDARRAKEAAALEKLRKKRKAAEASAVTKVNGVHPPEGILFSSFETGTGTKPSAGDWCGVLYRGTLKESGKQFDTNMDTGEVLTFRLGDKHPPNMIQGFDQAVAKMRVGGKCTVEIPAHLGYGAQGSGSDIPPHATLKFEIHLLSVRSPES